VSSDVVALSETSEFFLTCGVPDGEFDGSVVGVEGDGTDFYSLSGDVFFLEFACDVSLDEGGLAHTAVSDEDHFKFSDWFDCLYRGIGTYMLNTK